MLADPATGTQQILRREPGAQLTNPSLGRRPAAPRPRLRPPAGAAARADRGVRRRGHRHRRAPLQWAPRPRARAGRTRHVHPYMHPLPPVAPAGETQTLWSTALAPDAAYVTRIVARAGRARRADILRVPLPFEGRRGRSPRLRNGRGTPCRRRTQLALLATTLVLAAPVGAQARALRARHAAGGAGLRRRRRHRRLRRHHGRRPTPCARAATPSTPPWPPPPCSASPSRSHPVSAAAASWSSARPTAR